MRRSIWVAMLLGLSACGGSLGFEGEEDQNGFPITEELPLLAGSSGQFTFSLVAEGVNAGTIDFTASGSDPVIFSTDLSVDSAEVEDGVPFDVTVTIDVADTATTADSGNVSVSATSSNGDSASTSVYVPISE